MIQFTLCDRKKAAGDLAINTIQIKMVP